MPTNNDNDKFLQAVFGADWKERALLAVHSPASDQWLTLRGYNSSNIRDDDDTYWCIAVFPADDSASRTLARAEEVRALVIDDVGTKVEVGMVALALGEPTAIVETSSGNFQWVYRLAAPVPAAAWSGFFAEVERLVGVRLEGRDAVHLFRLPCGVNNKPGRGKFMVRLAQLNPVIELSGIDPPASDPPPVDNSPHGTGCGVAGLRELLELIPNKAEIDRDEWVSIGHWAKGLCPEGCEAFVEWTLRWEGTADDPDKHTEESIRHSWDGFGNSGLLSQGGQLRAMAERINPAGFKRWDARWVFDDGVELAPEPLRAKGIRATPFKWMDLGKTAPRDWLYGDILLRKFISMTVAPGGVGKSSLVAVETLAQVTGKALLGDEPAGELRVWLWNLEDPYEETQKKLLAAAKHYGIKEADIGDRLFVDSGRDQRLMMAEMDRTKPMIVRPVIKALVEQIRLRGIDIVVIDPFVSCHTVPENDNMAQDMVVKEWGRVAEEGNCAVHLVDHTSKAGSQEVVTDSSRGAKAKTDAARVVRVVNRMTAADSKAYGIAEPWRYFNTFNDKANMAPPKSKRDWFRMESIWAGNGRGAAVAFSMGAAAAPIQGDSVGVAVQWFPPNAKALANGDSYVAVVKAMGQKRWRTDPRSPDWIGFAIAQGCGLLLQSTVERQSVKELLKRWISEGLFKLVEQPDENRRMREYIEIAGVY